MSSGHRLGHIAILALAVTAALPVPASAQGLLDFFFGGRRERNFETQFGNAYSDPSAPDPNRPPGDAPVGTGRVVSYCVRTCDGRYFPMQRYSNANPVQLCNSFCPASKTQVYTGSDINYAVAANGLSYPQSENAFVYRKQIVAGCTCNGRDAFGLAPIDLANDPTIKQGDIVVTAEGPMTLRGNTWTKAALNLKTTPAPAPAPVAAAPRAKPEPKAEPVLEDERTSD